MTPFGGLIRRTGANGTGSKRSQRALRGSVHVQDRQPGPAHTPLGAAVPSRRQRSRRFAAMRSIRRSRNHLTRTTTVECCSDGSLRPPRLIPSRNKDWEVFDRRGPPHKQSISQPAHAGRDGQKPNQAARPGGSFRSSGFPIRDAVPARIRPRTHTRTLQSEGDCTSSAPNLDVGEMSQSGNSATPTDKRRVQRRPLGVSANRGPPTGWPSSP
jgi:hypothetical protein